MESDYARLAEIIKQHNPNADLTLLRKAYEVADTMHNQQKRKSGEPFIIHPVAVATMLAEMEMDMPSIIAGMLHDVIEDTPMTYEDVEAQFGKEIAYLVDGVTKLNQVSLYSKEEQQAENIRKMQTVTTWITIKL